MLRYSILRFSFKTETLSGGTQCYTTYYESSDIKLIYVTIELITIVTMSIIISFTKNVQYPCVCMGVSPELDTHKNNIIQKNYTALFAFSSVHYNLKQK